MSDDEDVPSIGSTSQDMVHRQYITGVMDGPSTQVTRTYGYPAGLYRAAASRVSCELHELLF